MKRKKPLVETNPVNCLRCKQSRMLPHTDLSLALNPDAIIPIMCGRINRPRPAVIHDDCPIADGRKRSIGGDFSSIRTPLELEFLKHHYPTATREQLTRITRRNWSTVKTAQQIHGVMRPISKAINKSRGELIKKAMIENQRTFSPEQRKYLIERHQSGDWPVTGGHNAPGSKHRQRQNEIKADIVANVARLGRPFKWHSIINFIYITTSPSGVKLLERRRERRRKRKSP